MATKFCTVALNISSVITASFSVDDQNVYQFVCTRIENARLRRGPRITLTVLGPQYRT